MAVDLPSLADALVLVVLLVPGFVAAKVFARITALDRKLSDFDMTVLSFVASLIIYIPFSYLTSLDSIDQIRDAVLMPQNIILLLSLSVAIGLLPGLAVKKLFRPGYHPGTVWDSIVRNIKPKEPTFVLVHTALGQEIMGLLDSVGAGDTPKDLRLLQPELIIRNKNHEATRKLRLGKQMFVSEKDVQSIAFL
jgi:hypothetical protein